MQKGSRIIVDWDGTITRRDTLHMVVEKFGDPQVFSKMEGGLGRRALSLEEVIRSEFATLTAPLEEVVHFLQETVTLRAGFRRFNERFAPEITVLSSGFIELIEPVMQREQLTFPLIANRLEPAPNGWRVIWTEKRRCDICGESCKRMRVIAGTRPVLYVGDGYSDWCGAQSADRIFARATLARLLKERGIPFTPFETFDEITAALEEPCE